MPYMIHYWWVLWFFLSGRVLGDCLDASVIQHLMWMMKKSCIKASDASWYVFTLRSTDEAKHKIYINKPVNFYLVQSQACQKGLLLNGGFCSIEDSGARHEFVLCEYLKKGAPQRHHWSNLVLKRVCASVYKWICNFKHNIIMIMRYIPICSCSSFTRQINNFGREISELQSMFLPFNCWDFYWNPLNQDLMPIHWRK
jgi:hypothetical protein